MQETWGGSVNWVIYIEFIKPLWDPQWLQQIPVGKELWFR
jgi:hypothetical protein